MLRLKLEYYEVGDENPNRYASEAKKQVWLEVVVDDSSHADQLVTLLKERLSKP